MCNFKVGQKVVFVDDNYGDISFFVNNNFKFPVLNEIYTIRDFGLGDGLLLEEIVNPIMFYPRLGGNYELYFLSNRFRPLDHAFADEVEAMIKKSLSTVAVCFSLLFGGASQAQDTICLNKKSYENIYAGLKQGEYYKSEYKNCLEVSTHLHELNKQLSDSLTLNIEKLEESYYENDKLKYELEQKTPWYKKWYVLLTAGIITGILIN